MVVSSSIIKEKDGIPEYCRVTGYVLRSAYFEVRLPTSSWNGKFYRGAVRRSLWEGHGPARLYQRHELWVDA